MPGIRMLSIEAIGEDNTSWDDTHWMEQCLEPDGDVELLARLGYELLNEDE